MLFDDTSNQFENTFNTGKSKHAEIDENEFKNADDVNEIQNQNGNKANWKDGYCISFGPPSCYIPGSAIMFSSVAAPTNEERRTLGTTSGMQHKVLCSQP